MAHCALVVGAGTRDELKSEYGLAHFAEHAFFKGTQRRRAYQVNCRLENLGGELNAYTTKEDTTLHAPPCCAATSPKPSNCSPTWRSVRPFPNGNWNANAR